MKGRQHPQTRASVSWTGACAAPPNGARVGIGSVWWCPGPVAAADVEGPPVAVATLARSPDATGDAEAQQQAYDVVNEDTARRRVVDAATPTVLGDRDGAVRRP